MFTSYSSISFNNNILSFKHYKYEQRNGRFGIRKVTEAYNC